MHSDHDQGRCVVGNMASLLDDPVELVAVVWAWKRHTRWLAVTMVELVEQNLRMSLEMGCRRRPVVKHGS